MNHLFWYVARAGGIVSWLLLTASVVWGLWLSGRVRPFGVRPAWILDLHRFLGGLATTFVGVHVGAILLDTYTNFGLTDVLVPFASSWHPLAVAVGIVAMYVLLAVELTSLARSRLPRTVWRRIHMAALPLWLLATGHFVLAGTDAANRLSIGAMGVAASAITLLFARRMQEARARPARPTRPAGATARVPARRPSHIPPRVAAAEDAAARVAALRAHRDLTGSRRR